MGAQASRRPHAHAPFPCRSRFLQGQDTDTSTVAELRKCISEGRECTVRLLNYSKDGRPFWNMLTVAPIRDVEGKPRFLVGVQIDVTAHPTEAAAAPVGASAASAVGAALQNLSWVGVDPWATFPTGPVRMKPHRAGDAAAAALRAAAARDGKLRLRHFQRVRQLGSGDVGMVDLVQLAAPAAASQQQQQQQPGGRATPGEAPAAAPAPAAGPFRFALKSLEKREMLERNKVGRVKTEALILGAVDHPFLATCYAMLQTGLRAARQQGSSCSCSCSSSSSSSCHVCTGGTP